MDCVSRFKLRGFRLLDAEPGYLGWLPDVERFGQRGGASFGRGLQLGPRTADEWVPSFQVTFFQRSSSAFHIVSEDIQEYREMIRPQRPVIDLR